MHVGGVDMMSLNIHGRGWPHPHVFFNALAWGQDSKELKISWVENPRAPLSAVTYICGCKIP